jgi:hypothetical protein
MCRRSSKGSATAVCQLCHRVCWIVKEDQLNRVWSASKIPLPSCTTNKRGPAAASTLWLQSHTTVDKCTLDIHCHLHTAREFAVWCYVWLVIATIALHTLLRIRRVLPHALNTSCIIPFVAWAQTLACQLPLKHTSCTKHRPGLFLLLGCPILCLIQPSTATAQHQE